MSRPRSPGFAYPRKRGTTVTWWIAYWEGEVLHKESSGSNKRQAALDLLKKRLGEIGAGTLVGPEARRFMFEDLVKLLVDDYTLQGLRSIDTALRAIKHLRQRFGSTPAARITVDMVDAYTADRLRSGAAPATVQKELAALGRMFTLAVKKKKLSTRPAFDRLKPKNTRPTSFTDAELEDLLDVLQHGRPATAMQPEVKAQPDLVAPIVFASVTGWRMKSEVLKLEWRQVDFAAGTVTLAINTTKSGQPRVFTFGVVPRLAALMREQRAMTTELERATGTIISLVFHRGGRPIKSMHAAWTSACRSAGLQGRVPHDLRRTAARRLRALGMSDRDIMEMCGWESDEMLTRYLGRDPSGSAERLRARVAEAGPSFGTVSLPGARSGAKR